MEELDYLIEYQKSKYAGLISFEKWLILIIEKMKKKGKNKSMVCQIDRTGKEIAKFKTQKEAHLLTGVDLASINQCVLKKRNTAGGFIWRYEDSTNL